MRGFSELTIRSLVARLLVAMLLVAGAAAAETSPDIPALAGKRVALVIGNGAYGDLGALPNPPRDATDVAAALEALHFEVFSVVDGNVTAMQDALRRFGRAAVNADVALFFYAGHGLALDGENYLVPVGAQIAVQPDLRYETLSLSDVRRQLDFTGARFKMVILDACRNNPLARTLQMNLAQLGRSLSTDSGLAKVDVAPASGMLLVYATAPNQVALDGSNQRNSPFTTALLANIAAPQTDVRVMFSRVREAVVTSTHNAQTPWTEDGMLGEFQFNPVAPEPEKPQPPVEPADLTAWKTISASGDPADFEAFIATYPDSYVLGAAHDRLAMLKDPGGEVEAWKALADSTDTGAYEIFLRRYPQGTFAPAASFALQNLLFQQVSSGTDTGAIDAFVQRFPKSPFSSLLSATLAALKAKQASEAAAAKAAAVPPAAAPIAAQPVAAPPATIAAPNPAAPALVVASAPPPPASEPERLLKLVPTDPQAAAPSPDAAVLARANDLPPQMIQFALAALGYYGGLADGKFGPASRKAAAQFQRHFGVAPTGDLQPEQIVALMREAAESGDPMSEASYGYMFAQGEGVAQDYAEAAKWFGRAASDNNGYGQFNLGLQYRDGLGVPKDPAKARKLLELAAANGQEAAARAALKQMD